MSLLFFVGLVCLYAHKAFASPGVAFSFRGVQAGGLVSAAGGWLAPQTVAHKQAECGLWGCKPRGVGCAGARDGPGLKLLTDPRGAPSILRVRLCRLRDFTDALAPQLGQPGFRVWAG
jgi:hypothetical protein